MELLLLIPIITLTAVLAAKIARLRGARGESTDVGGRLAELERGVAQLQQELTETQERLDFAERMLSQSREERRIGGS